MPTQEPAQGKPTLVGEMNPYGADPHFALYPAPDGCAGWRLCTKVLGMARASYLESFERVNLITGGKWRVGEAREAAAALRVPGRRLVLLGSKVSAAFGFPFAPYSRLHAECSFAIIPHPSGLCRLWNEPGAFERARLAVLAIAPELAGLIGAAT